MLENLTMYEAILNASKVTPNATAIYYKGKKINFTKFNKLICKTASFLSNKLNIKQGDVVLISQPNIPESLIILYAVNKIGAVANMVHPYTPYNQIVSIYENTHSKVAFLFEQRIAKEIEKYRTFPYPFYITRIEDSLPLFKKLIYHLFYNNAIRKKLNKKTRTFKTEFKFFYKTKCDVSSSPLVKNEPGKIAVILHSGSTTGDPKTICLTNDNFNSTAEQAYELLCQDGSYVRGKFMLSVLPNFHGFGLCMSMHSPLATSFGCVLVPSFKVKEVIKDMNGAKNVICMCGVPRIYDALTKSDEFWKKVHNLNLLRSCFSGGDSLSKTIKDTFNNKMKEKGFEGRILEGFGLTESTSVVFVNTFNHYKDGSIGYPLRDVFVRIVDEDGNEVKNGEIGEITIKSKSNMIGYLCKDDLDSSCIKDGYLFTGDLGYKDDDNFVFFTSRKKRVVKVSGVATFPSEVEKLIKSIPGVNDVCVIGVEDDVMMHALKAYIVSDCVDKEGFKQTILDTCNKYLIRWSVPKYIEFIDEMPKTLMQKTDYRNLEKRN